MALSGKNYKNRSRRGKRKGSLSLRPGFLGVLVFLVMVGGGVHFLSVPSDAGTKREVDKIDINYGEILVPIDTIPAGSAFQSPMLRKELKLYSQITPDMVRTFDGLKGQYAKSVLISGQPVLKAAVTERQPVHVLTALLPTGYRAVAIEVQRPLLDNVDGWAQPGTDVDVIWITSAYGKEAAAVLAGPVKVLAANKATEWTPEKKSVKEKFMTVTLLLNKQDAVRIMLASLHGKITLGLRGLGDRLPHEGDRAVSSVIEDPIGPVEPLPVLSVTVKDPRSKSVELRKYDSWGRRITD